MKSLKNQETFLKSAKRIGGVFLDIISLLDYLTASRCNSLKTSSSATANVNPKIAIYVSFRTLHCDVYENALFEGLKAMGFSIIKIINGDESKYFHSFSETISRQNDGADLGAIRDIFSLLDTDKVTELFIFNSSLAYLSNIGEFLQSIRQEEESQVTVGVQSYQKIMHFQSFFYYASGKGVFSLKESFRVVRNVRSKRSLINFGEIWISRRLIKSGTHLNILYPYQKVLNRKPPWYYRFGISLNPSIECAENLIDLGAPFVKRKHPNILRILEKDRGRID